MGDEFRREIAAASLPSTRVTNVTKSDCGIALVKKGRKAKVVSGPQTVWGKHHSFSTAPTRPRRGVFEFFAGGELGRSYRYVDFAGLYQVRESLRSVRPALGLDVGEIFWACDGVEGPPLGWCVWRARRQVSAAEEDAVYQWLQLCGFHPLCMVVRGRSDRKVWAQRMAAGGGVDVYGRPPVELLDWYRGEEGWQELVRKQVDRLHRRACRWTRKLKVRPWAAHGSNRSQHGDGDDRLEDGAALGYPHRGRSSPRETASELREAGRDAVEGSTDEGHGAAAEEGRSRRSIAKDNWDLPGLPHCGHAALGARDRCDSTAHAPPTAGCAVELREAAVKGSTDGGHGAAAEEGRSRRVPAKDNWDLPVLPYCDHATLGDRDRCDSTAHAPPTAGCAVELREAGHDAVVGSTDGAAAEEGRSRMGGPGTGAGIGADGRAGAVGFGVSGAGEAGVDADGDGGVGEGTGGSDASEGSAEPAGAAADRRGGPGGFVIHGKDSWDLLVLPRCDHATSGAHDRCDHTAHAPAAFPTLLFSIGAAAPRAPPASPAFFLLTGVRRTKAERAAAEKAAKDRAAATKAAQDKAAAAKAAAEKAVADKVAAEKASAAEKAAEETEKAVELAGRAWRRMLHARRAMRVARQPATMRGGRRWGCCGKIACEERGPIAEQRVLVAVPVGRWRGMVRPAGDGQAICLRRGAHAGWVQGSARLRRPCGDRAITHLSELAPIPKRPRRC